MALTGLRSDVDVDFAREAGWRRSRSTEVAVICQRNDGFYLSVRAGDSVFIGHFAHAWQFPRFTCVSAGNDPSPCAALGDLFTTHVNTLASTAAMRRECTFYGKVSGAEALPLRGTGDILIHHWIPGIDFVRSGCQIPPLLDLEGSGIYRPA